ncbi:MAG TPA: YggS family pyridoxal phosphate-dependent enzyme [Trebonia sp.]
MSPPPGAVPGTRREQLTRNLAAVRARVDAACAAAGRDAAGLTLIAVTKTYPASDVLHLAGLGLTDFGENRDQEAAPKAAEVAAAPDRAGPVTWHFIGQLQTNKARGVARYASVVQSVDRAHLVRALGAAARSAGRELACLVQVSLDPADADAGAGAPGPGPARGGVPPARLAEVAAAVEAAEGLTLGGLMAVAPLGADPWSAFAPLRRLSDLVQAVSPAATVVSAGMSGDLEAAIACGATHLRIGTALLGNRSLPVR